jgi:hypothetical protein
MWMPAAGAGGEAGWARAESAHDRHQWHRLPSRSVRRQGRAHILRAIDVEDETIAELELIVGFDDVLAGVATHIPNRLRGLRLENRTAAVAAQSQLPWAQAYGRRIHAGFEQSR